MKDEPKQEMDNVNQKIDNNQNSDQLFGRKSRDKYFMTVIKHYTKGNVIVN